MSKWTTHIKYTFHCEDSVLDLSKEGIAEAVNGFLGLCVMVEDYTGAWEGEVTRGFKVTYIAPCDLTNEREDELVDRLENFLRKLTGNSCIMPVREGIQVRCSCK